MSQTTFPATQIAALAPDDSTRLFSGPFLVLNLSALFSAVSFSSMLPLTALLVTDQTGGGDVAVGFAIGVFAITAIAARPLIGHLGDAWGRRFLVVSGCFMTALTFIGHVWADTYLVIVIMRLLTGAFQGAFFVGSAAMVSDLAPEHRRGEALSWFSVSIYSGMAIGPGLGEIARDWGESSSTLDGYDTAFVVAGLLMLAASFIGMLLPTDAHLTTAPHVRADSNGQANDATVDQLSGTQALGARSAQPSVFELVAQDDIVQTPRPTTPTPRTEPVSKNTGRIFYRPALWPGAILAMGIIIFPALQGFLPKLSEEHNLGDFGPVFFVYGILVLVLRVIGRKLPDRLGTKRTATVSLIGAATGMAVIGTFVTRPGLYIGVVILALGGSLLYPALMLAAVDGVPPNERARAVSTFTMFFELSAGIGGPLLGVTAAISGATVGAFYGAAVCSLFGIILLWIWQRNVVRK